MNDLLLPGKLQSDLSFVQELLDDPANAGNPLLPVVQRLYDTVQRLDCQFDKVSRITDRYQTQLKEINFLLDEEARTDILTGLPNRRDMTERIAEEIHRCRRSSGGFAILVMDIDHFKHVNDTYGHPVGDQVIVYIAEILQSTLRASDLCARWGGEEFLVLLPDTGAKGAASIAQRLCDNVASSTYADDECCISPTVSIGIAAYAPDDSLDALISTADSMLYQAKLQGRNRVCSAPGYLTIGYRTNHAQDT